MTKKDYNISTEHKYHPYKGRLGSDIHYVNLMMQNSNSQDCAQNKMDYGSNNSYVISLKNSYTQLQRHIQKFSDRLVMFFFPFTNII